MNQLVKKGKKVGIEVQKLLYDSQVSESEILDKISELNLDKHVYGIIVQKPLPQHFDESALNLAIDPFKDVDAFHPAAPGDDCQASRSSVSVIWFWNKQVSFLPHRLRCWK